MRRQNHDDCGPTSIEWRGSKPKNLMNCLLQAAADHRELRAKGDCAPWFRCSRNNNKSTVQERAAAVALVLAVVAE